MDLWQKGTLIRETAIYRSDDPQHIWEQHAAEFGSFLEVFQRAAEDETAKS